MEIKFNGQYNQKTFFRAVQVANQPRGSRRWIRPIMLAALLISAGVLVSRLLENGDVMDNAMYIVVVMILGSFVYRAYTASYFAARRMWTNPNLQEPLVGYVNKKGITYILEDGVNVIPWARYNRVRKESDVVALVTRDGLMTAFPRSFFKKDADWQKFIKLVGASVISMT
ncbi:MAG: YcxB family protein [Anaerolineales bacterium]|nr:YcxB family protein [Anaerolineales bacterium]